MDISRRNSLRVSGGALALSDWKEAEWALDKTAKRISGPETRQVSGRTLKSQRKRAGR
ncbi:MAG: hypothetical protein ABSA46_09035 [Thermodesulfovibrionales bacterium]|jgi:hypothetical protein